MRPQSTGVAPTEASHVSEAMALGCGVRCAAVKVQCDSATLFHVPACCFKFGCFKCRAYLDDDPVPLVREKVLQHVSHERHIVVERHHSHVDRRLELERPGD
jgi:hypothetical protein